MRAVGVVAAGAAAFVDIEAGIIFSFAITTGFSVTADCCVAPSCGASVYVPGLGILEDAYGGRSGWLAAADTLCGTTIEAGMLCGTMIEADMFRGTTMSSIKRSCIGSSPFRAGRGPRAGSVNTFQGHSGGIIHSTTSRVACPLPLMSPCLSTL